MILLLFILCWWFETHQETGISCGIQFCCHLYRLAIPPSSGQACLLLPQNQTAEKAAFHLGLRCYCEVISCSLADHGNTKVLFLFCCITVRKSLISSTFNLYSYYFSPGGTTLTGERDLSTCVWGSIRLVLMNCMSDFFTYWQLLLVHRMQRRNSQKICCNFVFSSHCMTVLESRFLCNWAGLNCFQ